MVSKKETRSISSFVCGQLRDEPDLSTLTIGILKKRYLALVGCQSLSPEAKHFMRQVVLKELMKMQDIDKNNSEPEAKTLQKKRKRQRENEVMSDEDESTAKKSRRLSGSSSDSEDEVDSKSGGMESQEEDKSGSEDGELEKKRSKLKTNGNRKHQISSDDSADEELKDSEEDEEEIDCGDSPEKNEARSDSTDEEKNTPQSNEENDSVTDNKQERSDKVGDDSSTNDSETEEKVSVEKAPPSVDEKDSETDSEEDSKNKSEGKKSIKSRKDDNVTAIVRLKHYIALCGVRRNYKKLLDGCRSVGAKVAVLKKELEDLGVHGRPSIQKCEKARKKREEAQEVAELDVNNIIVSQGRPRRRAAWQEQPEPRSPTYVRTLNSGSDGDEENDSHQILRRAENWANLRGIISDESDSD